MQTLMAFCQNVVRQFDLDDHWEQLRDWLTREDHKKQRRVAFAVAAFFLAFVILLFTTCNSRPQIHP